MEAKGCPPGHAQSGLGRPVTPPATNLHGSNSQVSGTQSSWQKIYLHHRITTLKLKQGFIRHPPNSLLLNSLPNYLPLKLISQ